MSSNQILPFLLYLLILGCANSTEVNINKNNEVALDNSYYNEPIGIFKREFFMYTGFLQIFSNNSYELEESTCLGESIEFGNWKRNLDTIVLQSAKIVYKSNQYASVTDQFDSITGHKYNFPGLDRKGTQELNKERKFLWNGRKLQKLDEKNRPTEDFFE